MRLSPRLVHKDTGRLVWKYGRQMIPGLVSTRLLQSAIPIVIAQSMPIKTLTYYSIPQKILEYGSEGVGRIGLISAPRASEWMALGKRDQIVAMGEYANRYCLTLWLVLCGFLAVFGQDACGIWWNREVGDHAGPLLLAMLVGQLLWPGQFISAAILNGIGRFTAYSTALLVEAILTVAGFAAIIPLFGLVPAIVLAGILMIFNRVVFLGWLFSKEFGLPFAPFIFRIYRIPVLLASAATSLLWCIRYFWIPNPTLWSILWTGAGYVSISATGAVFLVLEKHHRDLLLEKLHKILRKG
jgi:O-antigen/teichoic acid export membrane protein